MHEMFSRLEKVNLKYFVNDVMSLNDRKTIFKQK